jgi:microcystin-dependent protein
MGMQYIGEIRMVAFNFPPKGWALCNGQTMLINQNQPLFSLLGTTFGGNGTTNFLLPDFRSRTAMGAGTQNNQTFVWGQLGGEEQHTLTSQEMAGHTHQALASNAGPTSPTPSNNFWPTTSGSQTPQYATTPINVGMASNAIAFAGNNQPHPNIAPYQVVNFIIALTGIYPSRN